MNYTKTAIFGATGVISAGLWLVLLEATDFNAATVGAGVLAVLSLTGRLQQHRV